jgi:hypothetical protein
MQAPFLMLVASAFMATPLPPFEAPPAVAAARCSNHCPTKLPRPVRTGPVREKMGPPAPPLVCPVKRDGTIGVCTWQISEGYAGFVTAKFVPATTTPPQTTIGSGVRYRASGRLDVAVTEQGKYI